MSTPTTTMGISTDIAGVGSLPCQDQMEYVKSENVERNLNNGINTVELNFTNTRVEHTDNRVAGIQNQENLLSQILSNTNNIRSEHDVHQLNNNNFHHIVTATLPHFETHPAETSPTLLTPEPLINSITDNASITNLNNIESPTMMWQQEEFDFSTLPSYDLCESKDTKFDENSQNDDLTQPPVVHFDRNCNSGLADCMDNEETFEITHQEDGMILTATQEIIANGISTQDFMAFQNLDDSDGIEFVSHNATDEAQIGNGEEIELDADPMMGSSDLFKILEGFKTENKLEPTETRIDQDENSLMDVEVEVDEKATQQLLALLAYSNSNLKKNAVASVTSSTPVKKNRGHQSLTVIIPTTSAGTDVDTAQVVDTIFKWENVNAINDDIPSPLEVTESVRDSSFRDQSSRSFLYEDITQTSQLSSPDSRFDGSDFTSTAPPTPFSTVSYNTTRSTERKRRGRPPKTHSAEPDPQQLKQLSSSQRRYIIQRYKNNEASRQSRLNRKNKQDQLMEEESLQQTKNDSLRAVLEQWKRKEERLKQMLRPLVRQA